LKIRNNILNNSAIKWSGLNLDENVVIKLSEDLIIDLICIAEKKNVNLDEKLLKDLKDIIVMVYRFNNSVLIKLVENLIIDLKGKIFRFS